MKIKYLGPSPEVLVGDGAGGVVAHRQGQAKDYPDDVGRELLATMRRQKFELVEEPKVTARKAGGATAKEPAPAEGGTAEPAPEAQGGTVAVPEPGGGPVVIKPGGEVPTAAGVGGQAPRKGGKGKGGK